MVVSLRRSFRRSRKGLDTIVAEVLMLLIVIIMSSIVFIWAIPTFQSSQVGGNSVATYSEKFSTLWGNFASFAPSIPESLRACSDAQYYGMNGCTPSGSYISCPPNSPITVATTSAILVPSNGVCLIEANVGGVYVQSAGSNVTIIGPATIHGIVADDPKSITLKNVNNLGFTLLINATNVNISGSTFAGNPSWCEGGGGSGGSCDMSIYEGGRGTFIMTNSTVNGQVESEVGHQTLIMGNTINGRLEVESADFGQISNNKIGMLDLDQNGIIVVSGNTIYGNDPYYSGSDPICAGGTATAACYGCGNGYVCGNGYGNRWCAAGNNVFVSGAHNEATCIGTVEIDLINTGNVPVNLVAAFMSNVLVSGPVAWKILSGGPVHTSLPIVIPVGQGANVTMQWTPPQNLGTLPWTDIYFIFVSSHGNYVDGHVYFGYNPALTVTTQSRPENRVCPPCY